MKRIAYYGTKNPQSVVSYYCGDCDIEVNTSGNFLTAFCPSCASEMEYMKEKDANVLASIDEFTEITCKTCKNELVASEDNVKYCIVCGFDVNEDSSEELGDVEEVLKPEANEDEEDTGFSLIEDIQEVKEEQPVESKCDKKDKEVKSDDEDMTDENVSEEVNLEEDLSIEATVLEASDILYTDKGIAYVVNSELKPIAIIRKENLPEEVRSVYGNEVFSEVFKVSLAKYGVKETLDFFNAEPIEYKVDNKSIIAKVLSEEKEKLQAKVEEFKQDLIQSILIATQGINKGFWKDTKNPLREILIHQLKQIGITQAEVIVDTAISQSIEDTYKNIFAKALELVEKPVDVRNELAKTIDEANFLQASVEKITASEGDVSYKAKLIAGNLPISTANFGTDIDKEMEKEKLRKTLRLRKI